ncbi:MAG: hypothetical protein AAF937_09210 [Planctomycetota bacterium]
MDWWVWLVIVLGCIALISALVQVTEKVAAVTRDVSDDGNDMAPGWMLRCTRCQSWRPAAEAGVVRLGAASKGKRTISRCSACGKLTWVAIERGPGESGKRRIDDRTNESIWPETLASV